MRLLTAILFLSAWTAFGTTYYVDFAAGSDAANGTSTGTAWKHIPQDANATGTAASTTLQSGDTVNLKGGVVYTPADPSVELVRAGVKYTTGAGWGTGRAIIDGTNGGATNGYAFKVSANSITFDNLEIRDFYNGAIWVDANTTTVTNCYLHTLGPMPFPVNSSFNLGNGVFSQTTTNTIVASCVISNCSNNGLYFNPNGDSIIIHGNEIGQINNDAIGYSATTYFLISSNIIHNVEDINNHGDGMQILSFKANSPLVICGNTLWDCTQNIFVEPYANPYNTIPNGKAYIFNNVVYNTIPGIDGKQGWYNGIVIDNYTLVDSIFVFNNTTVDLNAGSGGLRVQQRDAVNVITNLHAFNNLFYNSLLVDIEPTNGLTHLYSGYNLHTNYWRSNQSLPAVGANYGTLATYQGLWPTNEINSLVAPITFANSGTRNYRLQANSAAIGVATNLSTLIPDSTFNSIPAAFRPSAGKDKSGTTRGSVWDIGAYEYSAAQIPPPAGTNVTGTLISGRTGKHGMVHIR